MKQKQRETHEDVVDMLLRQHEQIRRLFQEVEDASPGDRKAVFDRLRALLAVHETAEEQIVHPAARRAIHDGDGDEIVDARLEEENQAKRMLSEMEQMDTSSSNFMVRLGELRSAVLTHADHEEREEFPQLRQNVDEQQRKKMAVAVAKAEDIAPTHPHPGTESAAKAGLAGPVASLMDRARDAMKRKDR